MAWPLSGFVYYSLLLSLTHIPNETRAFTIGQILGVISHTLKQMENHGVIQHMIQ